MQPATPPVHFSERNNAMLTMELSQELPGLDNDAFAPTTGSEVLAQPDPDYQFLTDIWVGIVLTLMVLSCVCCMCSCVLYHKFQQWKMNAIQARNRANLESGSVEAELPSYTIASGLPSYQEALEQLKKVKELTRGAGGGTKTEMNTDESPKTTPATLSVVSLFQLYNSKGGPMANKPS